MSDDDLVLGVDSSTQSTKAVLHRIGDGAVVAAAAAPHPRTSPPVSEQDPAAWWGALEAACAALPAALRARVGAVAVAAQQHGAVLVDARGAVVRPAKLWNDTESAPEAAALVARLGAEGWAAAAGSVPLAAFTITKLAWVAHHEPEAMAATATVLLPHDWLTWRLTGSATTDRGDASGTGYWSPSEERWRPDLLALVADREWESALPRVLGPDETAGALRADAAAALGLPAGIPVGPGTGDNMAAALSLGIGPGDLAVSIGTSGTVFSVSTTPVRDPSGLVAGFADATGRYLPLACTLNAALVTDAVARLLGVDHVGLEALWAEAPAGAEGVVLVPWLDGERTPDRPGATGLLTGFRSDVRRDQLARAAFEGVVCGLLAAADAIGATGVATGSGVVALVGGGAKSAAYRATLADLSGRPVVVLDRDEHVAAGAAIQAAAVLTGRAPVEVAAAWRPAERARVEPDPTVDVDAIRARYAAATQRA